MFCLSTFNSLGGHNALQLLAKLPLTVSHLTCLRRSEHVSPSLKPRYFRHSNHEVRQSHHVDDESRRRLFRHPNHVLGTTDLESRYFKRLEATLARSVLTRQVMKVATRRLRRIGASTPDVVQELSTFEIGPLQADNLPEPSCG